MKRAYKCPSCGMAAFYYVGEDELIGDMVIAAEAIRLPDGKPPDVAAPIRCGMCGYRLACLKIEQFGFACGSGQDVTGRRCGHIVEQEGELCASCELDVNMGD